LWAGAGYATLAVLTEVVHLVSQIDLDHIKAARPRSKQI
jgi:hypothetical protein